MKKDSAITATPESAGDISRTLKQLVGLKSQEEKEYSIISHSIGIMCDLCAFNHDQCVDLLTGWLWDENEASKIKEANTPHELQENGE